MTAPAESPLLTVQGLSVEYATRNTRQRVFDQVDLKVAPGEILGLHGPSGCGKTTLALAILRLLPAGAEATGIVRFGNVDLLKLTESQMRSVRGRRITLMMQDPRASLNPLVPAGRQVSESIQAHWKVTRSEASRTAADLLSEVGLADPKQLMSRYPHQLSIGECQRVLLAACLGGRPELLICDEPTSALDASNQLRILHLLEEVRLQRNLSILLITQDLQIIQQRCDRAVGLTDSGPDPEV